MPVSASLRATGAILEVLVNETWLPLAGRREPVAVGLALAVQPCDRRRPGPDFDGTACFRELEASGVHTLVPTLVTEDAPALRKAGQANRPPNPAYLENGSYR